MPAESAAAYLRRVSKEMCSRVPENQHAEFRLEFRSRRALLAEQLTHRGVPDRARLHQQVTAAAQAEKRKRPEGEQPYFDEDTYVWQRCADPPDFQTTRVAPHCCDWKSGLKQLAECRTLSFAMAPKPSTAASATAAAASATASTTPAPAPARPKVQQLAADPSSIIYGAIDRCIRKDRLHARWRAAVEMHQGVEAEASQSSSTAAAADFEGWHILSGAFRAALRGTCSSDQSYFDEEHSDMCIPIDAAVLPTRVSEAGKANVDKHHMQVHMHG